MKRQKESDEAVNLFENLMKMDGVQVVTRFQKNAVWYEIPVTTKK